MSHWKLLAALISSLFFLAACQVKATPPPPPPPIVVGTPELAPAVPLLTEEEVALAKAIFANDPTTKTLLGQHQYEVRRMGPWLNRSHEKIGALLSVVLSPPADVEGEWPIVDFVETDSTVPPYGETTIRLKAIGLRTLDVLVDFSHSKVVSMNPFEATELIPLQDLPNKE